MHNTPTSIKAIKTVVRDLGWDSGGLQFSRGVVGFFTGWNQHHQKMFTHFAHVLVDNMDCNWLVERNDHCVVMERIGGDGSEFGKIVDIWTNINIDFEEVRKFVENQRHLPYSFFDKNCKHFCYDFRRNLLGVDEEFGDYCQFIETKFQY
jgi:hypothetical protein